MRKLTLGAFAALALAGVKTGMPLQRASADPPAAGIVRISDQPIPETGKLPKPGESGAPGISTPSQGQPDKPRRPSALRIMAGREEGCTYSPDHGWTRPITYPIHRIPVEYHRYWPSAWYGEADGGISASAPRFPVVYMPTDTTQLGFYYQRVPQWRPNPYMIPPVPWPPQWHHRETPRQTAMPAGVVTTSPTLGSSSSVPDFDKDLPKPVPQPAPKP